MPRIDPLKLLTCLGVLLAPNGGIRSSDEVKRLAGLMAKFSKKLVSKCIYIQILKCTETKLLGEFMAAGGWSLSHMWLTDGILSKNWPLVQELLELLLCCPVDVTRLKSNSSPKLVKGLSKDGGHEGVRILATKLVEQWLKIVKGETMTPVEKESAASCPTPTTIEQEKSFTVNNNKISHATSNSLENTDNSELTDCSTNGLDEHKPNDELEDLSDTLSKNIDASDSSVQAKDGKPTETLVFKITVKDGKQVLKKVESSPSKINCKNSADNSLDNNVKNINGDLNVKIKERTLSTSSKESSSDRNKHRDKSRDKNNKDKESDRHKKTSSSHRRSSSSSKSSSSRNNSTNKSNSSSSSSKSSNRDKDRSRDKDKERSSKSSSSKSSSKNSSSSSSSKDSHRDKDKNKEKENQKDKVSQADKDKDTLAKVMPPSIDKLGKIPKKPKDDPSVASATAKKASISIEVRTNAESRPKTVKLFNSQFRSHGLAEEAPPPPSRKGLIKPANTSTPGTAIPSSLPIKRMSPPPASFKDGPPEKKSKLESPVLEKPRSIKLIEPKPKPSLLVESDLFMASLNTDTAGKPTIKKRKRTISVSTKNPTPVTETSPLNSPAIVKATSPKQVAVAPLKFYQDTLEDNEDKNEETKKIEKIENKSDVDEIKEIEEDVGETKEKKSKIEETDDVIILSDEKPIIEIIEIKEMEEETENVVAKPPGPGCGPNGPPGVLTIHRKKGPKKQLKWKTAEELEEIRYFELDETERVNVTKTFTEQTQLDRIGERESFMMGRKLSDDLMQEQTMWMPLIELEGIPPHPNGKESKEYKIQMDRERTVLQALYFNRLMIPDYPAEPDMEQYQVTTDPQVIPLEDITGNPDAVNDFTHMIWPDSRGSPPPSSMSLGGPIPFIPPMGAPPQGLWRGPGNGPPGMGPNNMWPGPMNGPMGGPMNVPMNGPMGPGCPPMGNFGNMMPDDINMMGKVGNGPMGNFPVRPPNGFPNGFNGPPGMNNDNRNRNFGSGPNNMEFFRPNGPIPNGPNGPAQNWTGNSRWNNNNSNNRDERTGQRWNPRNICKSFQNTGSCRNIDRCNFLHPGYNCPPF